MDLPGPDDIKGLFGSPFFSAFWPTIIGGLILFIALIKGSRSMMLIVLLLTAFFQAWHLGVFNTAG